MPKGGFRREYSAGAFSQVSSDHVEIADFVCLCKASWFWLRFRV